MNIIKKAEGSKLTLSIEGRLDTMTAPELEQVVKAELGGVETLVFDMKAMEYIPSAGLRVLLTAQKTMNKQGSMYLTGCGEDIMEIFEVTGFSDILQFK